MTAADNAPRLGIVTGLKLEAAIVRRWQGALGQAAPRIACLGPGAERAEAAARQLIDDGVSGLVSFGVAGALDDSSHAGMLCVPDTIRDENGAVIAVDAGWRRRFLETLIPTVQHLGGNLATTTSVIAEPAAKRVLRKRLDAVAVDMESFAVATAARAHSLPFLTLRAISDEADQVLPAAALASMRADGSVRIVPVLTAVMKKPAQLDELRRLSSQMRSAKRTLARVAHAGLPLFGLV